MGYNLWKIIQVLFAYISSKVRYRKHNCDRIFGYCSLACYGIVGSGSLFRAEDYFLRPYTAGIRRVQKKYVSYITVTTSITIMELEQGAELLVNVITRTIITGLETVQCMVNYLPKPYPNKLYPFELQTNRGSLSTCKQISELFLHLLMQIVSSSYQHIYWIISRVCNVYVYGPFDYKIKTYPFMTTIHISSGISITVMYWNRRTLWGNHESQYQWKLLIFHLFDEVLTCT